MQAAGAADGDLASVDVGLDNVQGGRRGSCWGGNRLEKEDKQCSEQGKGVGLISNGTYKIDELLTSSHSASKDESV